MSLRTVFLASFLWTFVFAQLPLTAQTKAAPKAADAPNAKAQPKAADAPKGDTAKPKDAKPKDAPKADASKPQPAAAKPEFVTSLALAHAASDKSIFFLTSNGLKAPDPKSKNKTEQLYAEKSLQDFFRQLIDEIKRTVESSIREGDEEGQVVAKSMPVLIKAVMEHPVAVSLRSFTANPFQPEVSLALVLDAEGDAVQVREAFENLIGLTPEDGPAALIEETIEGETFYHPGRLAPQEAGIIPRFGMFKSYLILTLGQDTTVETVKRLSGPKKVPEWLQTSLNEIKVERPLVAAELNVKGIWEIVDPLISIPQVRGALTAAGLLDLKRVSLVSGFDPVFSVNKMVVETAGPPKGVLALLPDKPLTAADLKGIPVNPGQAHVVRFDLENLVEVILQVVEQIDPSIRKQYDGLSKQGEGFLGFSVQNDLVKAFGDVWSVYLSGNEISVGQVPELIVAISVRDQAKLTKVHDKLLEQAKPFVQHSLPNASINEFDAGNFKGTQLTVNNMEAAWLITKDQFVLGLSSEHVKGHLGRLAAKDSLATNTEVIAALKRDPKTAVISYHDPKHEIQNIYKLIEQFSPLVLNQLRMTGVDFHLPELPPIEHIQRHLLPSVTTASRTSNGWKSEWQGVLPSVTTTSPAVVAIGAGLLLPGIQQARSAARRTQSSNNLKQIGLAMHNYHDVHQHFPERVSIDAKEKPLLSWRVQLLPYLDEAALYNEFHLDEPWDSEHNKKLIERMPTVFKSPNSPELAAEFKTRYVVAVSDGALFDGDDGPRIQTITDGTSNTIMVLEANDDNGVIWSKPDDLEIDLDDPLEGLKGNPNGGFSVLFADGSVRFLSDFINVDTFKALLTRAGGEVVGEF